MLLLNHFVCLCYTGVNEYCEEDEALINLALENNVFHFLISSVVSIPDFHNEVSSSYI